MNTFTVFGVDRIALKRTRHIVQATSPEQAEHLAHFRDANLLVATVIPGAFFSCKDGASAEPASV